ncbi:Acetylcholinesterase [Dufourea novaeangliae]|uniref:Carboxylic ester hydrolase n=1 Tax=Dufourea novaeangliae TaxID=178035 RepID=A0A154NZC8_DUFNO|nr:Acetylcholinesterase [Dufourea novaeangliae]
MGIPYAKPPLGHLRFKPPVPVGSWRRTLAAVKEGDACPQIDLFTNEYIGNEDCLYLNVFTPQTKFRPRSTLKPVMTWIYGGSFMLGYSNMSLYGPDFFIEEDVVLVSFNYRIGALGFLSLNHSDALGNGGLKDQNLALRWVRNNIAAFGGDPNQVTIFGQSAGAASVGLHVLSEKSRGLFKQSILMSGSPLCQWAFHSPRKARMNSERLGHLLGHKATNTDDLVEFLYQIPARDIVHAMMKVDLGLLPYRPTIENSEIAPEESTFLIKCPIEKYLSGNYTPNSMMLGYTHDESLLFFEYIRGAPNPTETTRKLIREVTGINGVWDKILANLTEEAMESIPNPYLEDLLKIITNIFFAAPIDLTQKLLSKWNHDHPIYYYRLSYQSKYSYLKTKIQGTAHTDDIGFLFNVKEMITPTDLNDPFNVFRKKMVSLWANFAKYGNPTPKLSNDNVFDVTWLDSTNSGMQLEINETSVMKQRLVDKLTEVYENHLLTVSPTKYSCGSTSTGSLSIF